MCESKRSVLVSVLSPERQGELEVLVGRMVRRRRSEFWIAGNDIEEEGRSGNPPSIWCHSPLLVSLHLSYRKQITQ